MTWPVAAPNRGSPRAGACEAAGARATLLIYSRCFSLFDGRLAAAPPLGRSLLLSPADGRGIIDHPRRLDEFSSAPAHDDEMPATAVYRLLWIRHLICALHCAADAGLS